MSPFEHGHFTFKVDVPLFVAREWHRHRTMSYNEVSGRYTEFEPRFYLPPRTRPLVQEGKMGNYTFVEGSDDQYAVLLANQKWVIHEAWASYQRQLQAGIAKEVARMVLPVSLMTQFYVTVNPRNLMQFLSLRNDKHALKEIRDAAVQMEDIFAEHMPLTYGAYKRYKIESADKGEYSGQVTLPELKLQGIQEMGGYIPRHKKNTKDIIETTPLKSELTYVGKATDRWTIENTKKLLDDTNDYHNRKPVRT
jgi:thymidylate synthase (FAD)